jgi:cytochrome P450
MTAFEPPYPARPARPLPLFKLLAVARRNLLAAFDERAFDLEFFSLRILNRRVFICNSPDTVAQALTALHESFERKTPQMRNVLAPLIGDGLLISDGATWRRRRRIVAPILHPSRLPTFAPIMAEAADEMAGRWLQHPRDQTLDIVHEMEVLTAEIICRTVFGRRLGAGQAREAIGSWGDYQRTIGTVDLPSMLGLPNWRPRLQPFAVRRLVQRFHRAFDEIIHSCEAAQSDGEPSMIRLLLEWRDPQTGEPLEREGVHNEIATLFLAGHETTANALAWTWYLLSQAPGAEARLHDELDRVLGSRLPTLEDVPRLVFTRAVIDEAMRLYPPVPMLGREAMRDETIRNRRVPAGSLVMVFPWLLHRHRRLWDKPDHFVPERFLPDSGETRPRYSYIPFGAGPRVCAGAAFGHMEAMLCVATLARRLRLRLAPGAVVEPVSHITLRPRGGLPMLVEPQA